MSSYNGDRNSNVQGLHLILHEADSEQAAEDVVSRAEAFMKEHYHESMTIEQLAALSGVSASHFMRLFKQRYGMSAMKYVIALRMNHAMQLLTHKTSKIKDIAREVGYMDELYFSRLFKKHTGIAPVMYKRDRMQHSWKQDTI